MKKWWILIPAVLLLAGCGAEADPVYETVGEVACEPVDVSQPQTISVWTPDDAAAEAMAGGYGATLYSWSDCELRVETVESGDIQRTLETITGMSYENLTVMHYEKEELQIYETVWSASGEDGVYLGRAMVADDGDFQYCVSLVSPETTDASDVYAQICGSFTLSEADAGK